MGGFYDATSMSHPAGPDGTPLGKDAVVAAGQHTFDILSVSQTNIFIRVNQYL